MCSNKDLFCCDCRVKCYSRKIDEYVPPNPIIKICIQQEKGGQISTWNTLYQNAKKKKKMSFVMQHKFDPKILVSFP